MRGLLIFVAGALLGASSVLSSMGRFDEAKKHAELAIAVSPAAAHQALANLALQQDRVDEALRQADLAGKADPTLPVPLLIPDSDGCASRITAHSCRMASPRSRPMKCRACARSFSLPGNRSASVSRTTRAGFSSSMRLSSSA